MIEWLILGAAGVGAGVYLIKRQNAKLAAEAEQQEKEFREMLKRAEDAAPLKNDLSYPSRYTQNKYVAPPTKPTPAPAKKTTSHTSDSGISEVIAFAAGAAISSWSDSSSSSSSSDSSSYSSGGGDSGGGGSSSDF